MDCYKYRKIYAKIKGKEAKKVLALDPPWIGDPEYGQPKPDHQELEGQFRSSLDRKVTDPSFADQVLEDFYDRFDLSEDVLVWKSDEHMEKETALANQWVSKFWEENGDDFAEEYASRFDFVQGEDADDAEKELRSSIVRSPAFINWFLSIIPEIYNVKDPHRINSLRTFTK